MADEQLREWMKQRYPQYANNLKLARLLYEREQKKQKTIETTQKDNKVAIAELERMIGKWVTIEGMVATIGKVVTGERCVHCFKKNCGEHAEKGLFKAVDYIVGDETDVCTLVVMGFADNFPNLGLDDVVRAVGRVTKDNDGKISVRAYAQNVTVIKTDKVRHFIEHLASLNENLHELIVKKKAKEFGIENLDELYAKGLLVSVDGFVKVKKQ